MGGGRQRSQRGLHDVRAGEAVHQLDLVATRIAHQREQRAAGRERRRVDLAESRDRARAVAQCPVVVNEAPVVVVSDAAALHTSA